MEAWFERDPARLKKEMDALESLGVTCKVDESRKAQGLLRLSLQLDGNNANFDLPDKERSYELQVVFPDSFPWFRPEVYTFDVKLPRHQHPALGNLCLLPRGTQHWGPAMTVAALLQSQLGLVLEKGVVTEAEIVQADLSEQAEPVSEYYTVFTQAPVLFDPSGLAMREEPSAFAIIGTVALGVPDNAVFPTRLLARTLQNAKGKIVYQVWPALQRLFGHKTINGILVEAPEHPPHH